MKKYLSSEPVTNLDNNAKFKLKSKEHYVASWYQPGKSKSDEIFQLDEQLKKLRKSKPKYNFHIQ